MQKNIECPVCGNTKFAPFLRSHDYHHSKENFDIVKCENCGLKITGNPPSEIPAYYENPDYISHSDTHKGIINNIYHKVREIMLRKKARWIEKYGGRKSGNLLDIGSGTGYFADRMQKRGWDVKTMEVNEAARSFAAATFGLKGYASLKAPALLDTEFSVITLWHVLEHVEDIGQYMKTFKHILEKDGTIVIAVPNPDSYDARKYGPYWAAYDLPRHLWHFAPKNISELANRYGFEVYATETMPMDAFYISMISERYKGSKFPFIKGVYTGFIARLSLFRRPENSSSLVYFLKRKTDGIKGRGKKLRAK